MEKEELRSAIKAQVESLNFETREKEIVDEIENQLNRENKEIKKLQIKNFYIRGDQQKGHRMGVTCKFETVYGIWPKERFVEIDLGHQPLKKELNLKFELGDWVSLTDDITMKILKGTEGQVQNSWVKGIGPIVQVLYTEVEAARGSYEKKYFVTSMGSSWMETDLRKATKAEIKKKRLENLFI